MPCQVTQVFQMQLLVIQFTIKILILICGNKMPTRCNRGFNCRSYCLFNMFRAPLCPSSGAQEYYTVVAACGISCCGIQVAGLVWSWGLCVRFAGCCSILQTVHITLNRHTVQLFTESDDTRGCNNTICPPEDEQGTARNMLRIVM